MVRRRWLAVLIALVLLAAAGRAVFERASPAAPGGGISPPTAPSDPASKAPAIRKPASSKSDASGEAAAYPPGERVDLDAVDRDRDLHGIVVTKEGAPVAGADVVAFTYPWRRTDFLTGDGYYTTVDGLRTRTGPDGTFAIRLRPGARRGLRVTAAGFATVRLTERLAGARVRVVLEKGVRLRVTAVDEQNRLVTGMKLHLWRTGQTSGSSVSLEATTGPDGDAVFEGLPSQSALTLELLSTSGPGNPSWVDLAVGDGPEESFRLTLPKGRTLTGRVVDDATGAPVAKARVGMNWVLDVPVETDADGRFALPGWTGRGIRDIHVLAEGYARWAKDVGDASEFDVRLRRGFEATGRIVDPGGRPLRGALVNLVASDFTGSDQRISIGNAVSDDAGRFRVTGLDPTLLHLLIVVADGFGRLRVRGPGPLTEAAAVDLGDVSMRPGRFVAGRVLDASGRPAAHVPVTMTGPTDVGDEALSQNSYGREESCTTDDLGRFAFADVAPGTYSVGARIEGGLPVTEEVVVAPGADSVGITLSDVESASVDVRVVDERGVPIPGAWVFAETPGGENSDARTDARGIVRLRITTESAQVRVFAEIPDRALLGCDPQQWAKGTSALTFVVREGDLIAGSVLDADGKAVANAALHFLYGTELRDWSYADDAGGFRNVVPKGVKVRIVFDGVYQGPEVALEGEVECQAPAADVVLRCRKVPSDGKLTVKVTSPDGDPVPGALVRLSSVSGRTKRVAPSDAQGLATFEPLLPNMRLVSVDGTGPWAGSGEIETTPDGRQIVVALRRGSPIRGVVVGADEKPVKADVRVARGDETVATLTTGDDGAFVVNVAVETAGPFRVEARDANDPRSTGSAENVSTGGAELRIVLSK